MLKNILSLLLSRFYSKQESELVGHQAMPSSSVVRLTPKTTTIDGWDSVFDGVASTDGFACLRFTADSVYCIASAQTENINVFTTPQVAGDILLCACPVAKGQVFTLCARQAKNIECWFTKTIGGGYQTLKNALLQGGGLCLSHWYSSLQRNSYRVGRNGLLNKAYRPLRRKLPSASVVNPLGQIGLLSPRPTTVSFALWPTQTRSLSKTMPGRGRDSRVQEDTQEPTLCVPRVALSRINWEQKRLLHPLFVSLLLLTAPQPNLMIGGASC